jgi:hypothetical protein
MKYLPCLVVAAALAISSGALAETKPLCKGDECIDQPTMGPGTGTGLNTKGITTYDTPPKAQLPVSTKPDAKPAVVR